jgi:hypothetical protein
MAEEGKEAWREFITAEERLTTHSVSNFADQEECQLDSGQASAM